ncbi:efflux RND transporter periplasmic adaptor subunit [Acetoanaerobium sticklandii]|uniref:efflux RND transporter periplasmic adaptor subunit n=1 Tax=Acetoanaerobium sticklandii TaxID=1511 RepID=UPI003A8FC145
MNRKFVKLVYFILCISVLITGCQTNENFEVKRNIKNVDTIKVKRETYDVKLNYQGIINSDNTIDYFFTAAGKVLKINVKEGQAVKKGDILALLDTNQLESSYISKQSNLAISENTLEKTLTSYDTNIANARTNIDTLNQSVEAGKINIDTMKSALEANEALYEAGAIAEKALESQRAQYAKNQADFSNMKSQLDIAKKNLRKLEQDRLNDSNIAKENININLTSLKQAEQSLMEATLIAQEDGFISKIGIGEGDAVSPNTTVITQNTNNMVVSVGVSASDYERLASVEKILINSTIEGRIDNIAGYPDKATSTYSVDIVFDSDKLALGDIVDVDFIVGSSQGVFVPNDSVVNLNGVNYVFKLNSDNSVSRVQVDILDIDEDKMLVENLTDEIIAVTGVKTLKDNEVVSNRRQAEINTGNGDSKK